MKPRIAAALAASLAMVTPISFAEWKTLSDKDGDPYEVVADFRISELLLAENGDASFVAIGSKDASEIGFAAKISKPTAFSESDRMRWGDTATATLMQCRIDITSTGTPTKALEALLNTAISHGQKADELRVVGPSHGFCPRGLGHHISETAVYLVDGLGMSYDTTGKVIGAPRFSVFFVIDAPLGRLTAYFSRPPNIGGVSGRSSGRFRWFKEQPNAANKAPEPTPGAVTPRATEGISK